jgi:hypothetical protein
VVCEASKDLSDMFPNLIKADDCQLTSHETHPSVMETLLKVNLYMSNVQKGDANILRASPNSPVFQILPPLVRALLALPQVALDHDPGNSLLPGLELTADIIADNRLVLVVFGRVGVRGVDHERGVGVFSARGDVGEVFLDVIRPARRRQDSGSSARAARRHKTEGESQTYV